MPQPANLSARGFTLIELAVVILVIAVVMAGGYLALVRLQPDPAPPEHVDSVDRTANLTLAKPTPAAPTPTPTIDVYQGWRTYTDSKYHFSFKYPSSASVRYSYGDIDSISIVHQTGSTQEAIPISFDVNKPYGCEGQSDNQPLSHPYPVTLGQSTTTITPSCAGDKANAVTPDGQVIQVWLNGQGINQPYVNEAILILKSVQGLRWQ